MQRLLLVAAIAAVAVARPETYREKEDFKYSRSSTDEGSKSGWYGAQRGNMGGNYERAHNMDVLAQQHLGGAIRQVEGEIGDTADATHGHVFTAANTRGTYGQRQYDLSNLQGRNFQEGVRQLDESQSSLNSDFGSHSSGYRSGFGNSPYRGQYTDFNRYQDENQRLTHSQAANQLYREYARQEGHGSSYRANSDYTASELEEQRNSEALQSLYDSHTKSRYVGGAPVKLVIRPGSTVNLPVTAEAHQIHDDSSVSNQNSLNKDVEIVDHSGSRVNDLKPSTHEKHYESSYAYKKEWEKHDARPAAVPLAVPTIPTFNHFDNTQGFREGSDVSNAIDSNSHYSSHKAVEEAASRQSRYRSQYDARKSALSGSQYGTNSAYRNSELAADLTDTGVDNLDLKPKQYESSYSYHKSWERQGDPYVIKPVSGAVYDGSQRLTAASSNQDEFNSRSHQHNSQVKKAYLSHTQGSAVDCDCDDEHTRIVRSVDIDPYQQNQEYEGQEQLSQQLQHENLEDLGQQVQTGWGRLEDFDQQRENLNGFDTLEQQQTRKQWNDSNKLTQQQGNVHNLEKESHSSHELNKFDQTALTDLHEQQRQDLYYSNKHVVPDTNFKPQSQKKNDDSEQHVQSWADYHYGQEGQESQDFGQESQDFGQETQNVWSNLDTPMKHGSRQAWDHTTNEHVKPVWEQHDSQKYFEFIPITSKPGMYFQSTQQVRTLHTENQDTLTQSPQTNLNKFHKVQEFENGMMHDDQQKMDTTYQTSNLNNLWGQIDSLTQQSLNSNNMHEDKFMSSIGKELKDEHGQISLNENRFRSHNAGQEQWQWADIEDVPKTIKPATIKPGQELPTLFPKYDSNESVGRGRGDIGDVIPDDIRQTNDNPIFMIKPEHNIETKPYKTPEEIDALSLTKENKATDKVHLIENKKSEEDLSVIPVNDNQNKYTQNNKISTSTGNQMKFIRNEQNPGHFSDSHGNNTTENKDSRSFTNTQTQEFVDYQNTDLKTEDLAQHNINLSQIADQHKNEFHKENLREDQYQTNSFERNTDQQIEEFGQESLNLGQETLNLAQHTRNMNPSHIADQHKNEFNKESFKENQHQTGNSFEQNTDQQFEEFGQESLNLGQETLTLGQENLNLSQWSENTWSRPHLQEFDQQQHNMHNEHLEQQVDPTQQVNNFNVRSSIIHHERGQYQDDIIAGSPVEQEHIKPISVTQNNNKPNEDSPTESTSENPGFWKRVGNKLNSAKDKVSSWFSRSS